MSKKEGKYLCFSLGKEEYGIAILKVKEIIAMMEISEIPGAPVFIKGVINLRGKIIPLLDLRLKFSLEELRYTERTCIIVVEVEDAGQNRQIAIAVDAVNEVVKIEKEDIEDAPEYSDDESNKLLTGIAKLNEKVIILLDSDKAFNFKEGLKITSINKE
ncbi:chemotaxis protein CheW [Natronospora cellulosivora (SeqCode)]